MTGKEYLHQVWMADLCIIEAMEEQKRVRKDIETLKAVDYATPAAGGGLKRDMARQLETLGQADDEINESWTYWTNISVECGRIISRLSCGRNTVLYREILRLRYVCHMTWEAIAVKTGYSYRQVTRIHGKALLEFDKVFKEAVDAGMVCFYERSTL